MSQRPAVLLVISGPPCSGKSALARQLSAEFHLPVFAKDGIKEALFDTLLGSGAAHSRLLNAPAYEVLFRLAGEMLGAGQSLVLEANFKPEHTLRLTDLASTHPCWLLHAECGADGDVLARRFQQRWQGGERHPQHADDELYERIEPALRRGWSEPLGLIGENIRLDATDFSAPGWTQETARLRSRLRELLSG